MRLSFKSYQSNVWLKLVLPVIVLFIWEMASAFGLISSAILPPFHQVVVGLFDLLRAGVPPGHLLHMHILYSLLRVGAGFALASALALPLGLLMGWNAKTRQLLFPLIEFIRPIPPLAWIPISILWFGIGLRSATFIIFLGAFFPIISNTILGVRGIPRVLIEAGVLLGAEARHIFLKILVPGSLPAIFTGLKVGLGVGWMTLVAAEFTGIKEGYGLGFMIMTARDLQRPDQIMAGMAVIGLVGLGLNRLISFLERALTPWTHKKEL